MFPLKDEHKPPAKKPGEKDEGVSGAHPPGIPRGPGEEPGGQPTEGGEVSQIGEGGGQVTPPHEG